MSRPILRMDEALAVLEYGLKEPVPHNGRTCPHCNARHRATFSKPGQDDQPSPGTFSICAQCGGICTYTDELQLRAPTPAELDELPETFRKQLERLSLGLAKTARMKRESQS